MYEILNASHKPEFHNNFITMNQKEQKWCGYILEMRTGRAGPRAGPDRADLSRPMGRTGRKWAEILSRKNQGLHEKTKICCKINIKFTFSKETFLKFFGGFAPELQIYKADSQWSIFIFII